MTVHDNARSAFEKVYDDAISMATIAGAASRDQEVADLRNQINDIQTSLTSLQSEFNAYKASHPDAPKKTMLIGAAVDTGTQAQVENLEAIVGDLHVIRSYDSGFPTTWQQGKGAWHPDRTVSWHSLKPDVNQTASGALDQKITAWVASIPATHKCMLTFQHEPENPSKNINTTQFRTAFKRFYNLVKAQRPDILVGPIYMSWTFNPQSGRKPDDWWVGSDCADFLGIDTYETYAAAAFGSPTAWTLGPEKAFVTGTQYAADKGVPVAIGECNAGWGPPNSTDPNAKVEWAQATINYAIQNKAIAVCWFNTEVNSDVARGAMIQNDQLSIDYFSGLLSTPPEIS